MRERGPLEAAAEAAAAAAGGLSLAARSSGVVTVGTSWLSLLPAHRGAARIASWFASLSCRARLLDSLDEVAMIWPLDRVALHFRCRRIALKNQDVRLLLKEEKRRRNEEEQKMLCGVIQ